MPGDTGTPTTSAPRTETAPAQRSDAGAGAGQGRGGSVETGQQFSPERPPTKRKQGDSPSGTGQFEQANDADPNQRNQNGQNNQYENPARQGDRDGTVDGQQPPGTTAGAKNGDSGLPVTEAEATGSGLGDLVKESPSQTGDPKAQEEGSSDQSNGNDTKGKSNENSEGKNEKRKEEQKSEERAKLEYEAKEKAAKQIVDSYFAARNGVPSNVQDVFEYKGEYVAVQAGHMDKAAQEMGVSPEDLNNLKPGEERNGVRRAEMQEVANSIGAEKGQQDRSGPRVIVVREKTTNYPQAGNNGDGGSSKVRDAAAVLDSLGNLLHGKGGKFSELVNMIERLRALTQQAASNTSDVKEAA